MKSSTDQAWPGPDRKSTQRVLHVGMVITGILLLVMAAILNPAFLTFLSPNKHLTADTVMRIHRAQLGFAIVGAGLMVLAVLFKRLGVWVALSRRPRATNILLMLVSLLLFIFVSNTVLSVRYTAKRRTNIFIADEELGWKYKPNAVGEYLGARYFINDKGLRSPHDEYEKPANTQRILQLGDSVTAGNGLPYESTTAFFLERMYNERPGAPAVQVINAGCDGYSPWQEYAFLKSEGFKYDPDLVIVGFVLNDVTAKFRLKKFGGSELGDQLQATEDYAERSQSRAQRLLERTPLYLFLRDVYYLVRFGPDVMEGARKLEELQAYDLIHNHDSEIVQQAWQLTLENLGKIVSFCEQKGITLVIVHVPFAIQMSGVEQGVPTQQLLAEWCRDQDLHYVDCLPAYLADMREFERPSEFYFNRLDTGKLDSLHPSAEANKIIAQTVYDYIAEMRLLAEVEE